MMISANRPVLFLSALTLAVLLGACSGLPQGEAKYPTGAQRSGTDANDIYSKPDSIFGEGGLFSLGKNKGPDYSGQAGIGVNAYLWRASLDTVSFMPLASADPFGGVILTDWYSPENTPNERYKLNVFILDRQLRADGVQVKVFRQMRGSGRNEWRDATTDPHTARQIEDTILTRARQIRVAEMGR